MASEDAHLIPLSQLANILSGYAFKGVDLGSTGHRVVKIAEIEPPRINLESCDRIPAAKVRGLDRFKLEDLDILVAMTGATTGKAGRLRTSEPVYLNQRVAKISALAGKKYDDFIWAIVSQPGFDQLIMRNAHGSAQPNVSAEGIGRILVPQFAPDEQLAIGNFVRLMDDKIELNRRMNATLEAMARALFQSWFVDFDPVRAKAAGQTPAGIDPATAALFPAQFEDSALGEIPKGWKAAQLDDAVDILDAKRIPLSNRQREARRGPYPYHGAASVMDYVDDYLFDGVYVLMGEDGSVVNDDGTPVLQYVWGKLWVNNHAHVLKGKDGVCDEHVFLHLLQTNIAPFVTGAVQPKLNQGNLKRVPFVLPSKEVRQAFAAMVRSLFDKLRANTEESRTLAALRDALLPQLLSGDIVTAIR